LRADFGAFEAIPNHHPIKVGTLSGIPKSIAAHHRAWKRRLPPVGGVSHNSPK
jgi:hypothetical protein